MKKPCPCSDSAQALFSASCGALELSALCGSLKLRSTDASSGPTGCSSASYCCPPLARVGHGRQGRVAGLQAVRQRRTSNPRFEHHERRPNLKYEDQDNAQMRGLGPLAWVRCKWRSGGTVLQLEQRANPSIERTFQRLLRALWPAAHVKR
jgi:hypothetical protein